MACLIVCALWLIICKVMQLFSLPLIDYVLDSFNLISDTQIIFLLWTIANLNDVGQGDVYMNSTTICWPMIAASCIAWVTLLLTIGRLNHNVSVFTLALGQVRLKFIIFVSSANESIYFVYESVGNHLFALKRCTKFLSLMFQQINIHFLIF